METTNNVPDVDDEAASLTMMEEGGRDEARRGREEEGEGEGEGKQIMFFSFGMVIIDEIHHLNNTKPPLYDLPGGAGLYALLGARLLSPAPIASSRLSWILDAGSDFPQSIAERIKSWRTSTVIRYDGARLTTRAWNGYGRPRKQRRQRELVGDNPGVQIDVDDTTNPTSDSVGPGEDASEEGDSDEDEHRAFKYLTSKRRLDVEDLDDQQFGSQSWHMVCSPSRCAEIVGKLDVRRQQLQKSQRKTSADNLHDGNDDEGGRYEGGRSRSRYDRGIVVWEPIPDLCTPDELERLRAAASKVDVVSPNAEELASFFSVDQQAGGRGKPSMGQDEMVGRLMGWGEDHHQVDTDNKNIDTSKSSSDAGLTVSSGSTKTTIDRQVTSDSDLNTSTTACIVREGKNGSTIYFPPRSSSPQSPQPLSPAATTIAAAAAAATSQHQPRPRTPPLKIHLPAYHTAQSSHQVIDPTGGGNTYLGALALALAYTTPGQVQAHAPVSIPAHERSIISAVDEKTSESTTSPTPIHIVEQYISSLPGAERLGRRQKALIVAGICACVAAGYAIEQNGVPELEYTHSNTGTSGSGGGGQGMTGQTTTTATETGREVWGGSSVQDRIEEYLAREDGVIRWQIERLLS